MRNRGRGQLWSTPKGGNISKTGKIAQKKPGTWSFLGYFSGLFWAVFPVDGAHPLLQTSKPHPPRVGSGYFSRDFFTLFFQILRLFFHILRLFSEILKCPELAGGFASSHTSNNVSQLLQKTCSRVGESTTDQHTRQRFAGPANEIRAVGAGRLGRSGQGISTEGVTTRESEPQLDPPTTRD